MKESILSKRKILGYDISQFCGIFLMIIPAFICLTAEYDSGSRFREIIENIRPHPEAILYAVTLYFALIIRYQFFRKDTLGEVCFSSIQMILNIWVLASICQVTLISNVSSKVLLIAVLLSWLGMHTVAGYSWIIFIVAAFWSMQSKSPYMGSDISIMIILAALSLVLQVHNIASIGNFFHEFIGKNTKLNDIIKNDINVAFNDASKRIEKAVVTKKNDASDANNPNLHSKK